MNSPDKLRVLVSFAQSEATISACLRPDWQVLLDSGAYTNFARQREVVGYDQYVEYLQGHRGRFWRYFALDRIADRQTSMQNFLRMLTAGLRPVPVFQRGANLRDLDELKQHSDLVAIGGIAGRLRYGEDRKYLHQVMRAANGHRVHLLGIGSPDTLRLYRPYSADCASQCVIRYGILRLWWDGQFIDLALDSSRRVAIDGRPVTSQRVLFARLCEAYALDPGRVCQRKLYTSEEFRIATLRGFIRYQRAMLGLGVQSFIVYTGNSERHFLEAAWDLENATATTAAATMADAV